MPPIPSCITSPLPDSTHVSYPLRFIRHQFRPSRSVHLPPEKTRRVVAHASQSFGIGSLVCSVAESLTASRSLAYAHSSYPRDSIRYLEIAQTLSKAFSFQSSFGSSPKRPTESPRLNSCGYAADKRSQH